jgi:predicted nucleic acid-binding Zn ribbon protein
MPTYTYDERMKVVKAMEASGAATCPRCGSAIEMHRLQSTQDKLLKRPGRPLYRCSSRGCACECTAPSHMTIPPPASPPAP